MRSRAIAANPAEPDEIDLTSLLDVVFIMLIFFVVTASFDRATGIDAGISDNATRSDAEPSSILIEIDADNQFLIDNRAIRESALRAHLALMRAEHPDFSVVVQPARGSTAQALVTALDTARLAGIYDVAVSDPNP